MSEYLCITLLSNPDETETEFKNRLSAFWTHMLRHRESEFEKVYAETAAFGKHGHCCTRKYLVELEVKEALERQLGEHGIDHEPIDVDDLYTKYEAAPPEWFWIDH